METDAAGTKNTGTPPEKVLVSLKKQRGEEEVFFFLMLAAVENLTFTFIFQGTMKPGNTQKPKTVTSEAFSRK